MYDNCIKCSSLMLYMFDLTNLFIFVCCFHANSRGSAITRYSIKMNSCHLLIILISVIYKNYLTAFFLIARLCGHVYVTCSCCLIFFSRDGQLLFECSFKICSFNINIFFCVTPHWSLCKKFYVPYVNLKLLT